MSNAIELKNVCKAYNGFTLENISFNFADRVHCRSCRRKRRRQKHNYKYNNERT